MSQQPKKNYYEILEIKKDATESDISKAYRKLAMKWHPDRHTDLEKKKIAEEKFKEITEANTILSDPEKRRRYDDFGLCDGETPDFSQQGFPDLSEIFGSMGMGGFPGMGGMGGMGGFGGMPGMGSAFPFGDMGGMPGMGSTQRSTKSSQEFRVKLKFQEIFNGCEKSIEIPIDDMCGECMGTGSKSKKKKTCTECNGKGIRMMVRQLRPGMISQQSVPCSSCEQKGWVPEGTCSSCNGKCTKPNKVNKKITIKKNFDYQTKMCIRESGNFDSNLGKKSDIYIVFKISDLEDYNIKIANEYDLVLEYPIHVWDAFSGHTIYYDRHPSGNKYSFKLNEVIEDGDIRFAKGVGLPNDDSNRSGKFIIKFNYIYPKDILEHDKLKEFLKEKQDTKGINKSEYSKEKLFNPETDFDEGVGRPGRNTNSDDGPGGVQCAQS